MRVTPTQPVHIAVMGLACRYRAADDPETLWGRFVEHSVHPVGSAVAEQQIQRIAESKATFAQFSIPPIYRDSINQIQLHLFEVAQQALTQAGLKQGAIDPEFTDVIFCTGFGLNRGYENYARVFGQQLAAEFAAHANPELKHEFEAHVKRSLLQVFSATSHDKVGEMASTIPARIAAFFELRGRAIALESFDSGGVEALIAAVESMQQGRAKAALIVAGQRLESPLMLEVLSEHGIDVSMIGSPFSAQGMGGLGEGICALVLKACTQSEPRALVYLQAAYLTPLRDSVDPAEVARWMAPLCEPSLVYIDVVRNLPKAAFAAFISGIAAATEGRRAESRCYLGAAQSVVGYTYAASSLTSFIKASLVVRYRQIPPSVTVQDEISIRFKDLLDPRLPTRLIAIDQSSISAMVAGVGLHGNVYAITLGNYIPEPMLNADVAQDIAVVGMGGCYGKAVGLPEYWQLLTGTEDSFGELNPNTFKPEIYWHRDPGEPGSYYIRRASALDVERISQYQTSLSKLGYSAAHLAASHAAQEAAEDVIGDSNTSSGPQRVLAVTASNLTLEREKRAAFKYFYRKVEDILHRTAEDLSLSGAEVRAGLSAVTRALERHRDIALDLKQLAASSISRLVAEQFGVRANCIAVEAACAGSLAAIEIAVTALRADRCDLALVTGVELPVNIGDLCLCSSQRMLAPDLIATFTDQAVGFTPGDGAGTVVLTRLDRAKQVGHKIFGVINAIASCTESKSMIAPNPSGQIKSMARAFAQVEYGSESVDYVETHGTGTQIGDQVEISSLAQVYPRHPDRPLKLGALKTRFGHCFAAAGMAGVLKVLLAMGRGCYPANLFRGALNRGLELDKHHFDVLIENQDWPCPHERPRRAAVNAFGTGGINFHLLLEAREDR